MDISQLNSAGLDRYNSEDPEHLSIPLNHQPPVSPWPESFIIDEGVHSPEQTVKPLRIPELSDKETESLKPGFEDEYEDELGGNDGRYDESKWVPDHKINDGVESTTEDKTTVMRIGNHKEPSVSTEIDDFEGKCYK